MIAKIGACSFGGRAGRSASTAALLVLLATAGDAHAATLRSGGVIIDGLANPRGLVVGPDGWLYVAEAGRGGNGSSIVDGAGETVSFGRTGAVSRYRAGVREIIASGLPSLAPDGGFGATGPHDIAFSGDGTLHVILGFGANPARRADLASEMGSELLGKIVSIDGGAVAQVADVTDFERTNDPDGEPNSNPFSLVTVGDGFVVTDAGGNDVLDVSATGVVSFRTFLPPQPNPLPFGPPVYQAVPTGAATGPGGDILVGQLTGFPFPVGGASVFDIDAAGLAIVIAGGFTNLIDVAYGGGMGYALELDSDSLLGPMMTGSLFAFGADGTKTLLYGGLVNPTGFALGEGGRIFVSENGLSPTDGRVIALAPVPLPASLPLLAGCLATLGAFCRRRVRHG